MANANWAFQNRQLVIGTCEELSDRQAQWELIDITERALGGYWEPPRSSWESRRESMLDLLGKPAPFTFRPALQISPDARLLIEALSGRCSYEKDRSDQRNIWWQVANAFSLVVSRATHAMAPATMETEGWSVGLVRGARTFFWWKPGAPAPERLPAVGQ